MSKRVSRRLVQQLDNEYDGVRAPDDKHFIPAHLYHCDECGHEHLRSARHHDPRGNHDSPRGDNHDCADYDDYCLGIDDHGPFDDIPGAHYDHDAKCYVFIVDGGTYDYYARRDDYGRSSG